VIAFYREIIQRVGDAHLQILLYHIPQYSGVPITLKIVEVLREEFPHTVAGLKESEGNMPLSKSILESFPGFKLYVAREQHIVEAGRLGASGAICGLANLYPELICSLYEQNEKVEELDKFFHALKDLPFVPAFKAWMEKKKGSAWGHMRPPLTPLSPAERKGFVD
jgi:4-hydroxy-tetrahydrodipicolinate synthase